MTVVLHLPPAPVGQQAPPARATTPAERALRVARGSLLLTTGTAYRRVQPNDEKILRQNAGDWHDGYVAGCVGDSITARSSTVGTIESWSWISGYIEGKAARLERVGKATTKLDSNREY